MGALRDVLTRLEKEGMALGHFNVADLVLSKWFSEPPLKSGFRYSLERPKENGLSWVRAHLAFS